MKGQIEVVVNIDLERLNASEEAEMLMKFLYDYFVEVLEDAEKNDA